MQPSEQNQIQGYVDGYREGRIYGWAWQPSEPEEALLIEVLVDGEIVAETAAWVPRADLSEAGIGDGRHGFDVPVALAAERLRDARVVVRVKDGQVLPGALVGTAADEAAVLLDADVAAFVASVLNPELSMIDRAKHEAQRAESGILSAVSRSTKWQSRDGAPMNFIVFCANSPARQAVGEGSSDAARRDTLLARLLRALPRGRESNKEVPGSAAGRSISHEHAYSLIASAFNAALAGLGKIHVARDPVDDVNRIYESCTARNESCLFLYYGLPHQLVLGARCPVMPVIAWDYPNIPEEAWGDDPRNDWRQVLAGTVGVIALSEFAATAVRNAMGGQFPVLAVPAPIFDRSPAAGGRPLRSPEKEARLEFQGLVFDSRDHVFEAGGPLPQPPRRGTFAAAESQQIIVNGAVFTAVVAPRDKTEDWHELLTAFVTEFSEQVDVTLVFRMTGRSISDWWWGLTDVLSRLPAFRCRVLALQDFPNDARYAELIAATHWIVNASRCEAVCLPLLEFMSGGRPAVTPMHTAMADFVDSLNAVVVRSEDTYCEWPHDPRQHFTTLNQVIDWMSLRAAMREAYRITKLEPARYSAMSEAAMVTMRRFCSDATVLRAIVAFLGLHTEASASLPQMAPA